MASTREYLDYVLEQLSAPEEITYRPMMGEYILYCQGKVVGGVYDDRLLLKPTPTALRLLQEAGIEPQMELPYDGAKEMILADVDRRELLRRMVRGVAEDLPEPKKKKAR
ncbi:MAG: TfoX/Sxy family protein [Clostridia bacterium]|nr:TfoX/Sxy family protein [Clostridia bacterium]MBR6208172.1 TfoX/Sxy family protein [Oscillospiraceae bacterium]MBR6860300.1 TfoX/Sxy family protein [Acidaminococcaceae bacterium]